MRILVLDDDDERHESFRRYLARDNEVFHVFTVDGAITALIGEPVFDIAFLDHDLNDHHYKSEQTGGYGNVKLNGFDVASFIAKILAKEKRPKRVVVHSWNEDGAKMMHGVIEESGIPVKRWEWTPKHHPLSAIEWAP